MSRHRAETVEKNAEKPAADVETPEQFSTSQAKSPIAQGKKAETPGTFAEKTTKYVETFVGFAEKPD